MKTIIKKILLCLVLLAVLPASHAAPQISISALPRTNVLNVNSLILLDFANGDGTYTTYGMRVVDFQANAGSNFFNTVFFNNTNNAANFYGPVFFMAGTNGNGVPSICANFSGIGFFNDMTEAADFEGPAWFEAKNKVGAFHDSAICFNYTNATVTNVPLVYIGASTVGNIPPIVEWYNPTNKAIEWNDGTNAGDASHLRELRALFNVSTFASNSVYVSKAGNDSTGKRASTAYPFLTLTAAKAAAVAGDTIFVCPGTYNENDLLKSNVNWNFANGAIVFYTGASDTGIFDDHSNAITANITGQGRFTYYSSTSDFPYTGVVVTQNTNTYLNIEASYMSAGGPNGATILGGNISVIWVFDCGLVTVNCPLIQNEGDFGDQEVSAVYWIQGNCAIHAKYIHNSSATCIGAAENTYSGIAYPYRLTETGMYIFADEITSTNGQTFNLYSDTILQRVWVEASRLAAGFAGNSGQVISIVGAGKNYFTCQKIDNGASAAPAIGFSAGGGGAHGAPLTGIASLWVTAQKISATNQWINVSALGTAKIAIQQYEDYGTVNNGIVVLTNNSAPFGQPSVEINGGHIVVTNGIGVNLAAGKVQLNNLTVDTTQGTGTNKWPLVVNGNSVTVNGCIFQSASGTYPIYATNAQTIIAASPSGLSAAASPTITRSQMTQF